MMEENADMVVDAEDVLEGVRDLFPVDQMLVVMERDGKFEILSTHSAEDAEDMFDAAICDLYDGKLGFDGE